MSNDAIRYELGLVVVGTIVFAVWQWWELKRDGELLRQRREREREQERELEQQAEARSKQTLKPPSAS